MICKLGCCISICFGSMSDPDIPTAVHVSPACEILRSRSQVEMRVTPSAGTRSEQPRRVAWTPKLSTLLTHARCHLLQECATIDTFCRTSPPLKNWGRDVHRLGTRMNQVLLWLEKAVARWPLVLAPAPSSPSSDTFPGPERWRRLPKEVAGSCQNCSCALDAFPHRIATRSGTELHERRRDGD